MKIAFIAYAVATDGGIEKVVYKLAEEASRRGHQVSVVAVRFPSEGIPGVSWIPLRLPRLPWALRQWAFALASAQTLRGMDFDLLHASAPTFAGAQVSIAHSVHASGSRGVRAAIPGRLRRIWDWCKTLAPLTDWLSGVNYRSPSLERAVAISETVKKELLALYPWLEGKVTVIPNGVDLKAFKPLAPATRRKARAAMGFEEGDLVLAFVARQFMQKGLEPILRALPLLGPRVKLLVAGANVDPLPDSYYHALADQLKVADRVRFLGQVPDTAPVFQVADLMLHPVVYEAFGLVIIEAFASGLPVWATEVGGPSELIRPGVNGGFIRRDPSSIAEAVRPFEKDQRRLATLKRGALKSSKSYSSVSFAAKHMALLKELA